MAAQRRTGRARVEADLRGQLRAARYQHVTDAMRTAVASEVGDLIWHTGAGGSAEAGVVPVQADALATVLAFAEENARRRTTSYAVRARRSGRDRGSPGLASGWSGGARNFK